MGGGGLYIFTANVTWDVVLQGDLLAGSLATFLHWSLAHSDLPAPGPTMIAAWGACRLTRGCAAQVD